MTVVNRVLLTQLVGAFALVTVQPALADVSGSALAADITIENTGAIAQADPVAITNIQIDQTTTGLMLRLDAAGELSPAETYTIDNTTFADIPNAVLQLPGGEDFVVSNPATGIAVVRVTALTDAKVRIAIAGIDAPPVVDLSIGETGLSAIATPGSPIAQPPDSGPLRIVVIGEGSDDDYLIPNASTATRTNTPLRDVPQSVQVIPRQVIEDQQATRLEEVLDDAAGVTLLGNFGGTTTNFAIRGFDGALVLRDGFRLGARGGATPPELANLERVEVLRGPSSVLSGQADPGGIINLISKQPLSEPYYNLQLQFGNRAISPSLDFSGPLTEDGTVLYRLNALYREEESLQDYDTRRNRFFIAPTVSWQISDRTDFVLNLEYVEDNNPNEFGTVLFGEGDTVIPFERVINNPEDTITREYLRAGYTLEHRFSENWQVRNQLSFISDDFDYSVFALPFALDEATGTLTRGFSDQFIRDDLYALYTNVQGEFNTGPVAHTLLFGVDWVREESEGITRFGFAPELLSTLNIFDPDYTALPRPDAESIPIFSGLSSSNSTDRVGIYIQDQIDILDNLILVAGLRYDTVNQDSTALVTGVTTNQYNDALTPRIGIVYQPVEPISLYASYSQSFNPNSGTDAQGQPFDPETGEGFEVGVRAELLDGQLAATLAYFNITKQNVLTADPLIPFASIATGEQRSRGVDFNVTGEILPGWNVIASYAYIDAEVTESTTDTLGNRFRGIPEHSASLWTAYEIQSGDLAGLGFGLGLNYVDERQGDIANSFRLDDYFIASAAAFYRRDNWQFRLNVDNLFDTDYIETTDGDGFNQVQPGPPLTVRASVSYTF